MTVDEIESYISTGSRSQICIFREKLKNLDLFVVSFYISGKPSGYVISIEFDPIDMVDDGEGWVWQSEPMHIDNLIAKFESHLGVDISHWENVTKSGRLSVFDCDIDNSVYQDQETIFKEEKLLGRSLVPKGVVWTKRP